jgi:hypothetical protein
LGLPEFEFYCEKGLAAATAAKAFFELLYSWRWKRHASTEFARFPRDLGLLIFNPVEVHRSFVAKNAPQDDNVV